MFFSWIYKMIFVVFLTKQMVRKQEKKIGKYEIMPKKIINWSHFIDLEKI